MKYPNDLTGYTFERLYVISKSENTTTQGKSKWLCKCSCGNIKEVSRANLIQGYVKSCGCLSFEIKADLKNHHSKPKDISGMRSGKLTVLHMIPDTHPPKCECKCECGNTIVTESRLIKSGRMKSCGCIKYSLKNNYVGKRFGKLTVVERVDNYISPNGQNQIKYRCICDCGNKVDVMSTSLQTGATLSCGCILSVAEERVAKVLLINKVKFERQYTFEDCKDKRKLPFDFAIFHNNDATPSLLIEIDGIQHYEQRFCKDISYVQKHDKMKNDFCKNHNIKLIRIPYWEFNEIEQYIEKEVLNKYEVKPVTSS